MTTARLVNAAEQINDSKGMGGGGGGGRGWAKNVHCRVGDVSEKAPPGDGTKFLLEYGQAHPGLNSIKQEFVKMFPLEEFF